MNTYDQKVKEITKDVADAIVRGETMIPVCDVGPLLEYIECLKVELKGCQERSELLFESKLRLLNKLIEKEAFE